MCYFSCTGVQCWFDILGSLQWTVGKLYPAVMVFQMKSATFKRPINLNHQQFAWFDAHVLMVPWRSMTFHGFHRRLWKATPCERSHAPSARSLWLTVNGTFSWTSMQIGAAHVSRPWATTCHHYGHLELWCYALICISACHCWLRYGSLCTFTGGKRSLPLIPQAKPLLCDFRNL